jgi:hypothetical protein
MRIAVVFDTPYDGWDHPDHERQMTTEVAAWRHDEPEMEYQVADALRRGGHDVYLLGVRNDLDYLVASLDELRPELVFNAWRHFTATPVSNTSSRACWRPRATGTPGPRHWRFWCPETRR